MITMANATTTTNAKDNGDDREIDGIVFIDYHDESQLESVMSLVGRDLSEPYSSRLRLSCHLPAC